MGDAARRRGRGARHRRDAGAGARDPRRARRRRWRRSWSGLDAAESAADGDPAHARVDRRDRRRRVARARAAADRLATTTLVLSWPARWPMCAGSSAKLQEAMLVGIPIVLLLAGAGGCGSRRWAAADHDMARRRRIPLTAWRISATDRTDELGQLPAFNGLVARLRAALQTQRQFMADASHELRTPVSVVRAAADVTLSREHRDEAEYREALAIVGGQARRLGRLVDDMLVLARADAGGYPLRPVDLYLDEVVAECRRAVDVLAAERGVTIRAAGAAEIPFRGDEDLLRRLVLNVLQNAVQHTPPGGVGGDRRSRAMPPR